MTTPTPPYISGQQTSPSPAPAPAPKSRMPLIIGAIVALVVVAAGLGIGISAWMTADQKKTAASQSAWDKEQAARASELPAVADETLPDPTPTEAGPPLNKADLRLTLKTVDKQCFGSAGCNVDVKVQATMLTEFESEETWEVTYEISGDESGPVVGSFELVGGKYDVNEESLSTKSSKTKVAVKVVSVEKLG